MPDILVLDANEIGSTYIMGDIHGRVNRLEYIDQKMSTDDTLFIVGDLTDRFGDSVAVIKKIRAMRAQGKKVFSAYGNHEAFCLQTLEALDNVFKKGMAKVRLGLLEEEDFEAYLRAQAQEDEDIAFHLREQNGGRWLLELYIDEYNKSLIYMRNDSNEVIYDEDSDVHLVRSEIAKLPFIIKVKPGRQVAGFKAVHADMPCSDEDLRKLEVLDDGLSEDQIHYLTTARPKNFQLFGRNAFSMLTYCGHNILGNVKPVRQETNTIDIDGGGLTIIINHTKKEVFVPEEEVQTLDAEDQEFLNEISWHLEAQSFNEQHALWIKAHAESILDVHNYLKEKCAEPLNRQNTIQYICNQDILLRFGVANASEYYAKINTVLVSQLASQHLLESQNTTTTVESSKDLPREVSENPHSFFKRTRLENSVETAETKRFRPEINLLCN